MKRLLILIVLVILAISSCSPSTDVSDEPSAFVPPEGSVSEDTLRDKLIGAWVGQMAGVVLGADNEFYYRGEIMPDSEVPDFSSLNINNAFWQDDLYVEITFLNAMAENGYNCSIETLGDAFAATTYGLDHSNKQARLNLQNGIPASEAGSYLYNFHCDDIDWQIEADFLGQLYAGRVQDAAERAFEVGQIICYGDGVYGGVFVAALHSAAYVCTTVRETVDAAVSVIPADSKFGQILADVIDQYDSGKSWTDCWQFIQDNWGESDRCPYFCGFDGNIDAKLNAAYVLMGLLYGEGDFTDSMTIAMRCGQDSDCNPSTVGGVLGNLYGYSAIPEVYKTGLDFTSSFFLDSSVSLNSAVEMSFTLMKQILADNGAEPVEGYYQISAGDITAVTLQQWPAQPTAALELTVNGDSVSVNLIAKSELGIAQIEYDFGDGFTTYEAVSGYRYSKSDTYTISCRITDVEGNTITVSGNVEITVPDSTPDDVGKGEVRNMAYYMIPICSDSAPAGVGSKNIFVISDGKIGSATTSQYDTYIGYVNTHQDYFGYLFKETCTVSSLVFTEGMNFDNGGWFADGSISVQALINGTWTAVDAKIDPKYPVGNLQSDFGNSFETYTFTFKETECDGIRVIGTAGGSAGFVSCAELEVWACETAAVSD